MSQFNKFWFRLRTVGLVTLGATAIFTGLTAYDNRKRLFHTFIMPAVRLLPADITQNLAVLACKYRLYPASGHIDDVNLHTNIFGRDISNPIGIAAGFDKNGEAVDGLKDLGFGFVEVGSVTPKAQKDSAKRHALRLNEDRAIINYYIYDSDGHMAVAERLYKIRERKSFKGVVGVNLESSRDSRAPISDYVSGVLTIGPVADYLVVNYNSLERRGYASKENKAKLIELLTAVNNARDELTKSTKVPILLKLSPDMTLENMREVVSVIGMKKCQVDGLIVATSMAAHNYYSDRSVKISKKTGLSGQPLRDRSTKMIAKMYELTKGSVPIIGVGGVSTGQDAFEKIEAGASYVQVYTALVYEGPDLVERIKAHLSTLLTARGFSNVQDAVGSNYRSYLTAQ